MGFTGLCAKSMPTPATPSDDSSTLLSGYVSITGRTWNLTIPDKEDLGNQLATEGEAVKITNLFFIQHRKGHFLCHQLVKKKLLNIHIRQFANGQCAGGSYINLSPVSQSGEAHVCAVTFLKAHFLQRC